MSLNRTPSGGAGWNIGPVLQAGQRRLTARSRGLTSPGVYQRSESAIPGQVSPIARYRRPASAAEIESPTGPPG